ncbi:MAG: DUF4124 domain-containing protein [Nitrospira sp.]|nr:DUF4124 domain-containing protein [Nitrospira sp.]
MAVFILSFMSCVLLWPMVGSAELYKWTDDQGNFHITDTPPPVTKKKSETFAVPAPRSALPKKTVVRPAPPRQSQAEVQSVPAPRVPSFSSEEVSGQPAMESLSPMQATLTSSWHIFDSTQVNAQAPVQRWKDEQGLEHLVDVLPATVGRSEGTSKLEAVSASHARPRTKERVTSVSRSRHQSAE